MPAYIIATVNITDPVKFKQYATGVTGLSEKFGGQSIVKGEVCETLEGESANGQRVVVTRFPRAEDARAYINSPAYQSAAQARDGAAVAVMRLLVTDS